ncbi:hypothetical protein DUNSADRAFT_14694 [Dunaliella salina]|nr:hypothetical protein DUNSADRAFT_14694 [Dunaliella salina]|eukprot:KAF5830354.1 hypothetical protein DUNSADRAFT_14694 [Dunaliella salina]
MCAALNAVGVVDAVASTDVDVTLFGAETSYKHLHLSANRPLKSRLERCTLPALRQWLGLQQGGSEALRAVALLCGGDYNRAGIRNVGHTKALETIRCLLADAQDDSGVISQLKKAVEDGPDPKLLAMTKCTGCNCCGHDSGTKSKCASHKHGCSTCGTDSACKEQGADEACTCPFHRLTHARALARILKAASETPGYVCTFDVAAKAYETEIQMAFSAAHDMKGNGFRGTWKRRPDLGAVAAIMGESTTMGWSFEKVRTKLRPLLIEYDLRQGPNAAAYVEWRPVSIQRQKANAGVKWQYVLQLERIPGNRASPKDEAADNAWLQEVLNSFNTELDTDLPTSQWGQSHELDSLYLCPRAKEGHSHGSSMASTKAVSKGAGEGKRAVRMSMIRRVWPNMVQHFERAEQDKAQARAGCKGAGLTRREGGKEGRVMAQASSLSKAAKIHEPPSARSIQSVSQPHAQPTTPKGITSKAAPQECQMSPACKEQDFQGSVAGDVPDQQHQRQSNYGPFSKFLFTSAAQTTPVRHPPEATSPSSTLQMAGYLTPVCKQAAGSAKSNSHASGVCPPNSPLSPSKRPSDHLESLSKHANVPRVLFN